MPSIEDEEEYISKGLQLTTSVKLVRKREHELDVEVHPKVLKIAPLQPIAGLVTRAFDMIHSMPGYRLCKPPSLIGGFVHTTKRSTVYPHLCPFRQCLIDMLAGKGQRQFQQLKEPSLLRKLKVGPHGHLQFAAVCSKHGRGRMLQQTSGHTALRCPGATAAGAAASQSGRRRVYIPVTASCIRSCF